MFCLTVKKMCAVMINDYHDDLYFVTRVLTGELYKFVFYTFLLGSVATLCSHLLCFQN